MQIIRLHHAQITIPIGAESEAKAFYCGLLGLDEIPKPESLRSRGGFWLQVGDRQVHVGVEERSPNFKTKAHLAYEVDDITSWREALSKNAFEVIAGELIPGYNRFEIRDPFGNRVEFIQPMG